MKTVQINSTTRIEVGTLNNEIYFNACRDGKESIGFWLTPETFDELQLALYKAKEDLE